MTKERPRLGDLIEPRKGALIPLSPIYLQLSEDLGYVLYSALGSFYIPSCIMVFVYIRIYFAAKRRARRGIKKVPKKPIAPSEQVSDSFPPPALPPAISSR